MRFLIRRSVGCVIMKSGTSSMRPCARYYTYSSSGDSRKIVVDIVIGGGHCPCTLSKESDLS